jgi:hypothetical protein
MPSVTSSIAPSARLVSDHPASPLLRGHLPFPDLPKFPVRTLLTDKNCCSIVSLRELGGTVWAGAVDHRTRVGNPSSPPGARIVSRNRLPSRDRRPTPRSERRTWEVGNRKWFSLVRPAISYFPSPISSVPARGPPGSARSTPPHATNPSLPDDAGQAQHRPGTDTTRSQDSRAWISTRTGHDRQSRRDFAALATGLNLCASRCLNAIRYTVATAAWTTKGA